MKKLLNYIYILLGGIFLAALLMMLVYMLPTERMERNVRSSMEIFYTERVYPQQAAGYKSSQLDNETEAIMLLGAIYSSDDSPINQAMRVSRIDFSATDASCNDLIQYAWENKTPDNIVEYSRYWHGYMIWLKPLLLLLDYADIRMLNMMLQVLLLFILLKELTEKQMKSYLLPFAMSLIILNPAATAMSLQFSSIYYLILISMILILKYHALFSNKKRYTYLFFILGMATVFFDFLTYPLAAFCMPLILLLLLEQKSAKPSLSQTFKTILLLGICFSLGYIAMWAGKWLISSIILRENVVANALNQLTLHTQETVVGDNHITKIEAVFKNISVIFRWPYLLILGTYFICLIIQLDWRHLKNSWKDTLPFWGICLIPLLWLFVTSSHATWCYWYTYRGLAATVFSGFCALKIFPQRKKEN